MKNNILAIAILLLISNFFYDYSKQEIKVMEREKIVNFIKSEIINNFDSNNFEISSLGIENTFPLNKIIFSMDILNKENKRMVLLSSILYLFLFVYFVSHHTHLKQLDYISYLGVLNTLLIIFYSIKWFKKTILVSEFESLTQNPNFYFVSGFILYYTSTIVLFLLINTIYLNIKELISHFWMINIFFNIFHKTLLLIGIWKLQKQIIK